MQLFKFCTTKMQFRLNLHHYNFQHYYIIYLLLRFIVVLVLYVCCFIVARVGLEPTTPTLKVLSLQGIQKPRLRSSFKCYQLSCCILHLSIGLKATDVFYIRFTVRFTVKLFEMWLIIILILSNNLSLTVEDRLIIISFFKRIVPTNQVIYSIEKCTTFQILLNFDLCKSYKLENQTD